MEGFGLGLLPLQVRLCENKLDIIKRVFEECPDAYKQSEKVIGALMLTGVMNKVVIPQFIQLTAVRSCIKCGFSLSQLCP